MRARFLAVAGVGAVALIGAPAFAPGATAASSGTGSADGIPMAASLTAHGKVTGSAIPATGGLCKTKFGKPLPTPDGIISWNDTSGSGFNTAGAADITCTKNTKVTKLEVYGYFGAPIENFNVTFYGDSGPDSLNEPLDTKVVCSFTNLTGSAGGQYPTAVLTTLKLPKGCNLSGTSPGTTYWVSVQNNDSAGPWYWEMQVNQQGYPPDWRDVNDVFGSGCTTFDNDEYLVGCLGYTYGDWMLLLK